MNRISGKRVVYHISPLRFWLVPGLFLVLAGLVFVMVFGDSRADRPETKEVAVYMGLFFLAFAIVAYFLMRYTRLVLSPEGVKLYQFGYRLETMWNNIDYLDDSEIQGLVLRRSMECSEAYTLSNARNLAINGEAFYTGEQIRLLAERRFIPLNAFAYWFDRGNLREDLNTYIPGKERMKNL